MTETQASAEHRAEPVRPVRLGMAGVNGYGGSLLDSIEAFGLELDVPLETAAVYEAFPERAPERLAALEASGVRVYTEYDAMLADDAVDAVWLPVPIHLHLEMTRRALRAGKPVMCEKPAAGATADVDAMIGERDAAGLPVLIGFQEVYDPLTRVVKQRLMDGMLGTVRRVSVRACWPRDASYFARSNWAGRREVEGRPVHDSPLANALAHFVNLSLLFAGVDRLDRAADPSDVRATLSRANPIENFDTVTLACATDAGPEVMVWLTHASEQSISPVIRVDGDAGMLTRDLREVRIKRPGLADEVWPVDGRNRRPMFTAFGCAVRGEPCADSLLATLELARPHTRLVDQLTACEIQTVDAAGFVEQVQPNGAVLRCLPGIEERFARAQETGEAPLADLW
ncbi:MAG: Gfo/Idh/MocA family oxidoreductase [Planctomycetota bacterium]